jgi:hypothetical protein
VTGRSEPRVVPAYAITRGRTRPAGGTLPIEALVVATPDLRAPRDRDLRAILERCTEPTSIAEIASRVGLPIGVVRVLVADLAETGHVAVHHQADDDRPSPATLERLLVGLRAC